jgi:pyruvate dehydrogenase E1 component alpha subunit
MAGGCSKGKGGSMHMFDTEKRFYGGHGIVGAQVPIGAGLAFAHKYRGEKNIAVVYFGDGAMNQGQIYETFNMAALWKLPVLFILENNEYSMGTSSVRGCANHKKLFTRGEPYGIEGRQVDGMNVLSVYEAVKLAADEVRSECKPIFLEMKTYRYRGHSMSDPAKYREKEEVNKFKDTKDPIMQLHEHLVKQHKVKEAELEKMEEKVVKVVKASVEFAENSPLPSEEELYTDVYTE